MKKIPITLSYYMKVSEFASNTIIIPTQNLNNFSTNQSVYSSGVTNIYDTVTQETVGNYSGAYICIDNGNSIQGQITNYLYTNDGLIISWVFGSTFANLIIDQLIFGIVGEYIIDVTTKIGTSKYYGKKFNMEVSANNGNIYFNLVEII